MLKLSEIGLDPEEIEKVNMIAKLFNAQEVKIKDGWFHDEDGK